MSYTAETPESIFSLLTKSMRNPIFLATFLLLYLSAMGAVVLYFRQTQAIANLEAEIESQRAHLSVVEAERNSLAARSSDIGKGIDIFKRLSFTEEVKASPEDQAKLQAALSLNSFARYALGNRDFAKASDTLDQSLRVRPTLEAQYYLGVVAYLQGRNEEAVTLWTSVSKAGRVPNDLLLYLSVAQYRLENTETARRYADLYSRSK